MAGSDVELSGDELLDLAFEHLDQMARLLHVSGHSEIAALLHGMSDMRQLWLRRVREGDVALAAGPPDQALSYVLGQMADLADLLERQMLFDTAVLFRLPAALVEAWQARLDAGAVDELRRGPETA